VLSGLILPESAQGCSCSAPRGPWEARAEADAVFSGTAVEVVPTEGTLRSRRITFRVDNRWKGELGDQVTIFSAASTAACGFLFRENEQYIIYADDFSGRLSTNMCTRTAHLTRGQEDIEAFENTVFLGANYPEPFNPVTTIVFGLPTPADVSLKVYDRSGQLIKTLADGRQPEGVRRISFDGSDLPSEIYFYRRITDEVAETRSMVLLR
jgi:hypothetical protein